MFTELIFSAFGGNFLAGSFGAFVAHCIRIRNNLKPFKDSSDPPFKINIFYHILSGIIILSGGLFTAFLFQKANNVLVIECFVVGIMSENLIVKWVPKI